MPKTISQKEASKTQESSTQSPTEMQPEKIQILVSENSVHETAPVPAEPFTLKEIKKIIANHKGVKAALLKIQHQLNATVQQKNLLRKKREIAKQQLLAITQALKTGHWNAKARKALRDEFRFLKMDYAHRKRLNTVIKVKGLEESKKEYETKPREMPFEEFVQHLHEQLKEDEELLMILKRMLEEPKKE